MAKETLARMRDTGVTVRDIEFLLLDGSDQREAWLRMMEAGQALGASSLTVAAADPDSGRLVHTLARMTEDGRGFGITPTLEAISYQPVASIAQAADIARQSGCRIVVDTLHFNRFNGINGRGEGGDGLGDRFQGRADAEATSHPRSSGPRCGPAGRCSGRPRQGYRIAPSACPASIIRSQAAPAGRCRLQGGIRCRVLS